MIPPTVLRQLLSLDAERGRMTPHFPIHGDFELKNGPSSWHLQRFGTGHESNAACDPYRMSFGNLWFTIELECPLSYLSLLRPSGHQRSMTAWGQSLQPGPASSGTRGRKSFES